jgi:predicted AAA+ superfamily ATPase
LVSTYYYERFIDISLPKGQSAFLWGPRKTGKTTYLKRRFPDSLIFDFLQTDLLFEFSKRPSLLREQLLAADDKQIKQPVILDEVQKIPQILDEVHWLIENKNISFILCGSSARKLKRNQANLLGGRAWRYELLPFTFPEIMNNEKEINLLKILNRGLIPSHYFQENYLKSNKAYVRDYLKEEIFAEGLSRNIPAFSRFFEAMGYSHGQLTNFSNIARECGVDSKTVKEYYQILIDTLLGVFIEPYKKRQNRQIISKAAKFYLFDVGIAGTITKRTIIEERGEQFGHAFEHYILMELLAHRAYKELDHRINFWRTKSGLEVDFILGNADIAIEVKGSNRIENTHLRALLAFQQEHSPGKAFVVCNEKNKRTYKDITIIPWRTFLSELWSGNIIS